MASRCLENKRQPCLVHLHNNVPYGLGWINEACGSVNHPINAHTITIGNKRVMVFLSLYYFVGLQ